MTTDRELLELAAKAAGIKTDPKLYEESIGVCWSGEDADGVYVDCWNPLTDDGDALRLAVKLGMEVYVDLPDDGGGCTEAWSVLHDTYGKHRIIVGHEDDPYAATRKAIVRAAAEIGRGMK